MTWRGCNGSVGDGPTSQSEKVKPNCQHPNTCTGGEDVVWYYAWIRGPANSSYWDVPLTVDQPCQTRSPSSTCATPQVPSLSSLSGYAESEPLEGCCRFSLVPVCHSSIVLLRWFQMCKNMVNHSNSSRTERKTQQRREPIVHRDKFRSAQFELR